MAHVLGTNQSETLDASDGITNGVDSIYGRAGNDKIFALGGDDLIIGGAGADQLDGGAGEDTAYYYDSDVGVMVSLLSGMGIGGDAQGDTLVNIENLSGSQFDDILVGNDNHNILRGLAGSDILMGGGSADEMFGGDGNDTLKGGGGADHLWGGTGIDTVSYDTSEYGMFISLAGGTAGPLDVIRTDRDPIDASLHEIENAIGSELDDKIWGDGGANILEGLGGNDILEGFGGNDLLKGGDDDDQLSGGAGRDFMFGNAGADTFAWGSVSETGLTTATADVIHDFNAAHGDQISLAGIDADVYAAGNQAFTFIGTAAFSGTPGEIRYYHAGGNTYIEMQTGTSVDVEGVIRHDGIVTPAASWFWL